MENSITVNFSLNNIVFNKYHDDDNIMVATMCLLHTGRNRNNCDLLKDGVVKSIPSIYNKPIVFRLNNEFVPDFSTDVKSHAPEYDDNQTMNICGIIPESSRVEFIKDNEFEYLYCDIIIYKKYQPIIAKILKAKNGIIKVSLELESNDYFEDDDGFLVLNEFKINGVCLLGEGVPEGIENSHMNVIKFSYNDCNNIYNSCSKNKRFKIPSEVKFMANEGIKKRQNTNKNSSIDGLNIARYLINNNFIEEEKLQTMYKYFSTNKNENDVEIMLYGGSVGEQWIKEIVNINLMFNKEEKIVVENKNEEEVKVVDNAKEETKETKEVDNAKDTSVEDTKSDKDDKVEVDNEKEEGVVVDNAKEETSTEEKTEEEKEEVEKKEVDNSIEEQFEAMAKEFEAIKTENKRLSKVVAEFERKEELANQIAYIDSKSKCFSNEEAEKFKKEATTCTFAETKERVLEAVANYADNSTNNNVTNMATYSFAMDKSYTMQNAAGSNLDSLISPNVKLNK